MTYWNGKGRYQKLADKLLELVPDSGKVKDFENNPKLERLRLINNAYYDLYNNGGANNNNRKVSRYFPNCITYAKRNLWDACREITEPVFDRAVIAASVEQGMLED